MYRQILLTLTVCGLSASLLGGVASAGKAQDAPRPQIPGLGIVKGPFAPDVVPEALWDGRKIVAFHAMDTPKMVKAADADFIEPSEYVLGVTVEGQSRAYPSRFIGWHHIINDKVTTEKGDRWYAVTYCSVCNTGIRYNLNLNGKSVRLAFFGLYNGAVALCDQETESVFLQASGRYITGPLLGKELATEPLLDTTWGEWKRLHPDTLIMSPDSEYSSHYRSKGAMVQRGNTHFGMAPFEASMTRADKRLPFFDKVLGVSLPPRASSEKETGPVMRRAYPIKVVTEAGGVVNDMLGSAPVAVFLDPATISACAVSRQLDGATLTFEARKTAEGKIAFYDKETGTRWSIEGTGEEGPRAGKSLERLDAHLSQWYGWFAYYPETSIFGRDDPPQPADPITASGASGPPPKRRSR